MRKRVVIIGAGPGGYVAGLRAAQLGADVTIIEKENVGGTCLNRGCIPSKIMITAAEIMDRIREAEKFGIVIEGRPRIDMQQLIAKKQSVIQAQIKGILDLLKYHHIRYLKGTGYLKGLGLAAVRQEDASELEIPWDKLILATGTEPLSLPGLAYDGVKIISSNHALSLQEVPESILIIGGGVVGCEFAFLLSSLGSRVTIVEALSRMLPLPSVDEECSVVLQREMKKRKINFLLNRRIEGFEDTNGKLQVRIGCSPFTEKPSETDKRSMTEVVDKILVCVGRRPNVTNIEGIQSIGLQLDKAGWVVVNERLETTALNVYAIGDLLGPSKVMLAHVASAEGLVAAENAMGGRKTMEYGMVPSAIFTSPEIADVGLTEGQAREQGYAVRSDRVLFRNLGKAQVIDKIAGQAKIVSDADNGKILGIHIIGPHATDIIAEGTLAVRMGCRLQDLAETIHAHPTLGEIMLETSLKALGRPLHG